jgi:hypothetical protein
MDSGNANSQTKIRESYTFLMKGITSMDDLVEFKLYLGKCYDYARNRVKSELIYPVPRDESQVTYDDNDLRQGLFGELLTHNMMLDVKRLAATYDNPRQSPSQARIVLRFGHLHWGARGLTCSQLKYSDLLEELNQCIKRKANRSPNKSDRERNGNRPNGESYGQQRGRGGRCNQGQGQRNSDSQKKHNNSRFSLPDKCIQSMFFHPGGQKTKVFEDWLQENGFELEDCQERVVCNFELRENKVECILIMDSNLSILCCRLNKTRWNSTNIKTVEPGKPDIRINLETVCILDRVQLTKEKGLEKADFERPILEFEGGNSSQPIFDRKVIVPDHPDGRVKFVRLRQRKIYRFGNNDNTETNKYAALRNVRITVGTVRELELLNETSREFEQVSDTQPEVTVTLTELPDWDKEDEWQNLVWTFYQFGSAIADVL